MRSRPLRLTPLGLATLSRRALAGAEVVHNEDGTVDIIGLEILSAGGPIHGIGSPPEGDYWTLDELRAMADADAELGDELCPPNKIGHADDQALVQNSVEAGELVTAGEMPAVGWLEDLRVEGAKLLADLKSVPKVVYELIAAGAYRKVSVELSKVTSQVTGKSYEWVVTGLAWLGGKMPAVRTLGDIAKLYEGDIPTRRVYVAERELAAGDVAWSPDEGLEYLRSELVLALNPGPSSMGEPARFWVRDVASGKALVEDWQESGTAWIVPFEIQDGRAVPAASSDWLRAEEAWIEVGRANEDRALTLRAHLADTRPMRYSEEKRRRFAEALGLKLEEVTDEQMDAAGVPADETTPPAPTPPDTPPVDDPPVVENDGEADSKALEARLTALETSGKIDRRNAFVAEAIKDRKIHPGQKEDLAELFDRNPDRACSFVAGLPVRTDLDPTGADGEGFELDETTRELAQDDEAYAKDFEARYGVKAAI